VAGAETNFINVDISLVLYINEKRTAKSLTQSSPRGEAVRLFTFMNVRTERRLFATAPSPPGEGWGEAFL
jgi:hypothetical protein